MGNDGKMSGKWTKNANCEQPYFKPGKGSKKLATWLVEGKSPFSSVKKKDIHCTFFFSLFLLDSTWQNPKEEKVDKVT